VTAALVATFVAMLIVSVTRPNQSRAIARSEAVTTPPSPERDARRQHAVFVSGGALAVIAVTVLVDPILAVGVVLCGWLWPRLRSIVRRRTAQRLIEAALPDAIEMLVLIVYAGLTPHQAIAALSLRAPRPTRFAFVEVQRRVDRGTALADALAALPELLGTQAVAVADTLAIAERHGNPIALTLEQLATDVRERRRRRAEAAARRLPVRMAFPLVTCTLPAFVLIAIVPAVLAALRSLGDSVR
jgi:tight adherence protein C